MNSNQEGTIPVIVREESSAATAYHAYCRSNPNKRTYNWLSFVMVIIEKLPNMYLKRAGLEINLTYKNPAAPSDLLKVS